MGRLSPDSETDSQKTELWNILQAVSNNVPGLIEEMQLGRGGQKIAARTFPIPANHEVMRASGPLVTKYMQMFGAKLAFALHFETVGSPIPVDGGAQPMWLSNAQALSGDLPRELIASFPKTRTLAQGKRDVSSQFQYTSMFTEDRQHALFFAAFNASFAILAVTARDRSILFHKAAEKFPIFAPGFFKTDAQRPPNLESWRKIRL
jgi:hypothetical protein